VLRTLVLGMFFLFCWTLSSKADQLCFVRDALVRDALQSYERKARISGDIVKRISWYAQRIGTDQIDPRSIRREDVQVWIAALEEMLRAGHYALVRIQDFQTAGCDSGREADIAQATAALREGIDLAKSQIAAITWSRR